MYFMANLGDCFRGTCKEYAFSGWLKCSLIGNQMQLVYSVIRFICIPVDLLAIMLPKTERSVDVPPIVVDLPPSPPDTVTFCCPCFQPLFSGTYSFRFIMSFWLIEPFIINNVFVFLDLILYIHCINTIYSLYLSFEWSNPDKFLLILIICRI